MRRVKRQVKQSANLSSSEQMAKEQEEGQLYHYCKFTLCNSNPDDEFSVSSNSLSLSPQKRGYGSDGSIPFAMPPNSPPLTAYSLPANLGKRFVSTKPFSSSLVSSSASYDRAVAMDAHLKSKQPSGFSKMDDLAHFQQLIEWN